MRPEEGVGGNYREFVPSATGTLQFHHLCRFATTTTTLGAEISTNNGQTWETVWKRNGLGLASANWDTFTKQSVSLQRYAGKAIVLRFIIRFNNRSTVIETNPDDGFYLDSVILTGCSELVRPLSKDWALATNRFAFNASIVGEPLVPNAKYFLRIEPLVGSHGFGYGPLKPVVVRP